MRGYPELQFQQGVERILRDAGFTLGRMRMPVNQMGQTVFAFPDVCILDERGRIRIAIECKISASLHCMTQAIGQCLVYKRHAAHAGICVPELPLLDDIDEICLANSIDIFTPRNIANRIHLEGYAQAKERALSKAA